MKLILSLAFTAGLLVAGATSASAMTAPPAPHSNSASVIEVRDGCGRGYHENRRGRCVRNDDDRRGDGCGRYQHRNRWGRCVRNY